MLKNYLTIAIRAIRRHPGSTFINTAGLAIGMAGFIVIMLFVRDQTSYDRFHEHADRIFRINKVNTLDGADRTVEAVTSGMLGPALETDIPEVEANVRILPWFDAMPITAGETTIKVSDVLFTDPSFFDVFAFRLLEGDPASALVKPQSIVLSQDLARRLFGDSDPVGKTLIGLNDFSYTVTGVIENRPHNTHLRYDALISWSSTVPGQGALQFSWMNRWLTSSSYTFVELREGSDAAAFADKLPAFLTKNYPKGAEQYALTVQPLTDIHLKSTRIQYQSRADLGNEMFVYIFGISAFLILLIACINFVNMTTALADDRAKEVGVRKALGAYLGQLRKQFLGESVLLAALAFAIAVVVVQLVLPVAASLIGVEFGTSLFRSPFVLLLALPGVATVGVLAGFYPAVVMSRFMPVAVLHGSGGRRVGGARLRKILVASQFVISTVLLGGSVIVFQQTEYMRSRDTGMDKDQVLVIPLSNSGAQEHYDAFRAQVLDNPGVVNASASSWVPGDNEQTYTIEPQGHPEDENWIVQVIQIADFDFADTYGLNLAAGRFFSGDFPADSAHGVVINETLASRLGWDAESAVGKRLNVSGDVDEGRVIGVVKDFNARSLQYAIEPVIFINQRRTGDLSVRIAPGNIPATIEHLKRTWEAFETRYPFEYHFVDDTFASMYRSEENLARVLSLFAVLAMLVACLGLFGLAAQMARRRRKEIGIRKSLGATASDILSLLNGELVRLLAISAFVAIPIAYILADKWLESFAYRMPMSLLPFLAVGLAMIAVGVAAVSYQSIRAAVANPVKTLRYE